MALHRSRARSRFRARSRSGAPRRGLAALGALAALALLPLTGCGSGETVIETDAGPEAEAAIEAAVEAEEAGAEAVDGEDVEGEEGADESVGEPLPELDADADGGEVVLRQDETRGHAELPYGGGSKGRTLIVAVNCQGAGTVRVTLSPTGTTFPLECLDTEVSAVENRMTTSESHRAGTVSVRADSSVRWSLAVARDEGAEAGPPGSAKVVTPARGGDRGPAAGDRRAKAPSSKEAGGRSGRGGR
ncbi:hypothetical protein [Streptomyces sp. NPDC014894]|uniref:hypothetical protein n=1 Tax=Streptomyces sp. NPDC014894 TaxID=3364931 RepID=UPI0036FF4DE0